MPAIFDNLTPTSKLLHALQGSLEDANRASFCVGYFHIRGWESLASQVDRFQGSESSCCRVLVGMNKSPEDEMRAEQSIRPQPGFDGPTLARKRMDAIRNFKEQIERGVPTAAAEKSLRELARQLRAHKVVVKLFLGEPLHAKLYLFERNDYHTPVYAYLGSSNLTAPGLSRQGELNIDVYDQDASTKLLNWFEARWSDDHAVDISDTLAELIETSWAAEKPVLPYHIYLKMAYHLSEGAREGERDFKLPTVFQDVLLDFQIRAVSLAAHHLNQRGGVLLGDVVGLGKTLMATAVARIFQEDNNSSALIICPPQLKEMWDWHKRKYELNAEVLSQGEVHKLKDEFPRRLVVIDESHNLRNREGKRYAAIRDYIARCEPTPLVLLLTATPFNKQFTDLSNQLRLFLDEDQDLHVRPERFFQWYSTRGLTQDDFIANFQASPRSLRAFEQSTFPEDWRDLMRLFLVRRTRQFIMRNPEYATFDPDKQRYFVTLGGTRRYFPVRRPQTITFPLDEADQYARLYSEPVVDTIESLTLPRYGLTNYLVKNAYSRADPSEKRIIDNLNRAGRRLIGFHRTNLFKRLESSGLSFLLSLDHHVARNMVTLYALEHHLPIPIGPQDAAMLDTAVSDTETEFAAAEDINGNVDGNGDDTGPTEDPLGDEAPTYSFAADLEAYRAQARQLYDLYSTHFHKRFGWLPADLFTPALTRDLQADTQSLLAVLQSAREWRTGRDTKLLALYDLLAHQHPAEKVLIFTQFADTAHYLESELQALGIQDLAVATGEVNNPTALARRFSPGWNGGLRPGETELRVLVATDVLAEGQNLQDAHIVVNFDLPWAIIRLIQRAGRVDRIGQLSDTIDVYSFLPAEGVEQIINLRSRLCHRLDQNQEVIGTDESFFGEAAANRLRDLYTERAGILDDDSDEEVDLSSTALQIWNSASEADRKIAQNLPPVVSTARPAPSDEQPGAITYLRFGDNTDADSLVRVDRHGNLISQSITAAFRAATCSPDTPVAPLAPNHYELVASAAQLSLQEQITLGGQLGSLRTTRRKIYERLKLHREQLPRRAPLFAPQILTKLDPALDSIVRFPLKDRAREALGRQLNLGIRDDELADSVIRLYEDERLCNITEKEEEQLEPQIVCSLGLVASP